MAAPIAPILPIAPARPVTTAATSASGSGFGAVLENAVAGVEQTRASADTAISDLLAGGGDLHNAVLAGQRADLAFEMFMGVRNKVLEAYQEIMRMQI